MYQINEYISQNKKNKKKNTFAKVVCSVLAIKMH